MRTAHLVVGLVAAAVLATGCTRTVRVERRSQLAQVPAGELYVVLKTGDTYRFGSFAVDDSCLSGDGYVRGPKGWTLYSGSIALSDVDYAYTKKSELWKGSAWLVVSGAVGLGAILAGEHDGLRVWIPSASGSCPYVYVFDGSRFTLEHEAIAVALGRQFEMTTTHVCRHLLPTGRRITVKIANERPESHYLNRVAMRRVDVPDGCELVADDEGGLLLASGGIPCARAAEPSGGDAAQALAAEDREYWAGQAVSGTFEDVLELTFPLPQQVAAPALVITSLNTELADAVFNELFGCLGEDAPQFYRALDQDPEMLELCRQWLSDVSLHVALWNGNDWQEVGAILPGGNVAPFTRALRIPEPCRQGQELRVRISSVHGVWKCDRCVLVPETRPPAAVGPLNLTSAVTARQENAAPAVQAMDETYCVLLPGDDLTLVFTDDREESGSARYVLDVGGFLYEWPRLKAVQASLPPAGGSPVVASKMELVKRLIASREALLPLVYARWER